MYGSHARIPMPCLLIHENDYTHAEIPLKDVQVSVEMINSLAKVTLVQTYKNPLSHPARVSYVFPLDDRAAVTSFLAEFPNGRKLVGVSKEKGEARAEFEEAVASGHSAVLLDQESSDVFKAEIGNLEAEQEVKISITYLTNVVQESSRQYRFTLPTVLAPRYKPSPNVAAPDTILGKVPYGISIEMSVHMNGAIEAISSPTHEVATAIGIGSSKASVSLSGELDGDFVVLVKLKEPSVSSSIVVEVDTTQHEQSAVYINLKPQDFVLPPASLQDGLIELIFVIDVSGSMVGDKMRDTISAMQVAMQLLREDKRQIRFNIFPFSSQFHSLFPSSEPLNDDTYKRAAEFISQLHAGGGTELLQPLEHIGSIPMAQSGLRRVIVLTDGQVGNDAEIFSLVKSQSSHTQYFTVGIGNGVSHALVNGIATHGLGVSEYVTLGEQVSEKMARQLARALSSTSSSLKITYLGHDDLAIVDVIQSPRQLPPLYSESDIQILSLLPKSAKSIVVEDTSSGQIHTFPLINAQQVRSDILHKMAARAQIRDLELLLESDETHLNFDPRLVRPSNPDLFDQTNVNQEREAVKKLIVEIATRYNLMSSQTSFVAVDPDTHVSEPAVPLSVPVLNERGRVGGAHVKIARHMYSMPASMGAAAPADALGSYDSNLMMTTTSQVLPQEKLEISMDEVTPEHSDPRLEFDSSSPHVDLSTPQMTNTTTPEPSIWRIILIWLEMIFEILAEFF